MKNLAKTQQEAKQKKNVENFRKDFEKLLARYPAIQVWGDMSGEPVAFDGKFSERLPNKI